MLDTDKNPGAATPGFSIVRFCGILTGSRPRAVSDVVSLAAIAASEVGARLFFYVRLQSVVIVRQQGSRILVADHSEVGMKL